MTANMQFLCRIKTDYMVVRIRILQLRKNVKQLKSENRPSTCFLGPKTSHVFQSIAFLRCFLVKAGETETFVALQYQSTNDVLSVL